MAAQSIEPINIDSIYTYLRTLTEQKVEIDLQLDELVLQNENLKLKIKDYHRQIKDSIKQTEQCAAQTVNEETSMCCQTETQQTQDECVGDQLDKSSVSVHAMTEVQSVEIQACLDTKNNEIQTELSSLLNKEIKFRDYNSQRDISIMTEKHPFSISELGGLTIKNSVQYNIAREENFSYFPPNLQTELISFNFTPRGCNHSPICKLHEIDYNRIDIEWEEHIESEARRFTNLTISKNINEFHSISPYAHTTESSTYITESPELQPKRVPYEEVLTIRHLIEEKEIELNETLDRLTELEYENTELRKNLTSLKCQQATIKMRYNIKITNLRNTSTNQNGEIEQLKTSIKTISSQNGELKLQINHLEQTLKSQKQLNRKLRSKNLARYDKEIKMNLLKHNNRVLQILNQHLKYERDMILHTTCNKESYNSLYSTYLELQNKFSNAVESLTTAQDKNILYEKQIQSLTQEAERLKQQLTSTTKLATKRERVKIVKKKLEDLFLLIEDKI